MISLILELIGMPPEITGGILALYRQGLLKLGVSGLTVFITMICISVKRSFIEQSGMAVMKEPLAVTAIGIAIYGVCIALMLVFVLSIVGFPIAVLIFFIMNIFIFIGYAALSVMLGTIFADKINKNMYIYQYTVIGAIIIEVFKFIPYIGWLIQYLILPILALGAIAIGFSNGYLKKRFYPIRVES